MTEAVARTLYRVNQARARLTLRIAGSASLRQLDALKPRLTAANGPVEQQVRLIRRQLGLPPPQTGRREGSGDRPPVRPGQCHAR